MNVDNITAYRCAKYILIDDKLEKEIRVGKSYSFINELLSMRQSKVAAFITPENPYSKMLSDDENQLRHNNFLSDLESNRIEFMTGYGTDDDEQWGRENSYLLFLDDIELANELAKSYGQNAYLLLEEKQPAVLMLISESGYQRDIV